MNFEKVIFFLCLSLGGASFVFAISTGMPNTLVSVAEAAEPAAPREPQAIWDKLCKSCHGTDGRGNAEKAKTLKIDPVLLNLGREGTENLTAEERKTILLEGKEKMPAYKTKVKAEELDPLLKLAEEMAANARKTP